MRSDGIEYNILAYLQAQDPLDDGTEFLQFPVGIGGFDERDSRELGWGLGEVIATADIMMINEGALGDLEREIVDLLTRVEEGR